MLQFTKEHGRCSLRAYQAPWELYRLPPALGFQVLCIINELCKCCTISKQTVTWVFPSSYKVQLCSLLSASTRSFISSSSDCLISAYNAVSIKCRNLVNVSSKSGINFNGFCLLLRWSCIMCSNINLFGRLRIIRICIGGKHFGMSYVVY